MIKFKNKEGKIVMAMDDCGGIVIHEDNDNHFDGITTKELDAVVDDTSAADDKENKEEGG